MSNIKTQLETYTLKEVMSLTSKSRSWVLRFLQRNSIIGTIRKHIRYYSKKEVDNAWSIEKYNWSEWVPTILAPGIFGIRPEEMLEAIASGQIRTKDDGSRQQLVSSLDLRRVWKQKTE